MSLTAFLTGTLRRPEFRFPFERYATMPGKGVNVQAWIKNHSDRRWDPTDKFWYITGTGGKQPTKFFSELGIQVDYSEATGDLLGVHIDQLVRPGMRQSPQSPHAAMIAPRLAGYTAVIDRLGPGAVWDKKEGLFNTPVTELVDQHGNPKPGFIVTEDMVTAAQNMRKETSLPPEAHRAAAALAMHEGAGDPDRGEDPEELSPDAISHLRVLAPHTGRIPPWFGLALFPFQKCGAYAVAAGHSLLADEPGLGKGSPASVGLLTPAGWSTYGQIRVGDPIIGSDGHSTEVTGVFPRGFLKTFRVTMSDGASVVVDAEHLWQVNRARKTEVLETQELAERLRTTRHRYTIPLVKPVHLDPYFTGSGVLGSTPAEHLARLQALLELHAEPVDGEAEVRTASDHVRDQVVNLAQALGGTAGPLPALRPDWADEWPISGGELVPEAPQPETLRVCLPLQFELFAPGRKATACSRQKRRPPVRRITSIEPAGIEQVVCISVAAPDCLYVTEHFIVTHNTRTGLAAASIRKTSRLLVVCPPLVLTNWAREVESSFGPSTTIRGEPMYQAPARAPGEPVKPKRKTKPKPGSKPKRVLRKEPPWIAVVRATGKVPEFPKSGVVIVADSLLTGRPELFQQVIDWAPEAAIYDEVHRSRTWDAKRSSTNRAMSEFIHARGGLNIPTTGTPMLANPTELTNILAMSGHLYSVWKSAGNYLEAYAKKSKFGWTPKMRELPKLNALLNEHAWVRRNKKDVLKQLPKKWRTVRRVDIDEKVFKAAHEALYEKVGEWLSEFQEANGRSPMEADVKAYSQENIGLMSPLRVAAGVAKAPAASQIVTEWLEDTTVNHPDGTVEYTRPLIVWAHHKEVLNAVADAVREKNPEAVAMISGNTSSQKRSDIADDFQDGKIGVLVCSIIAAGFGITLTRSSDVIFVEQDWTPAHISQAEDRVNRIGQLNPCMITTLFSDDTLDPSVRAVLMNKAEVLNKVMPGSDNNVTEITAVLNAGAYEEFTGEEMDLARSVRTEAEILGRIVDYLVAQNQR